MENTKTQNDVTPTCVAIATKLLVSVRNVVEAEAALLGGADVIDVKEPLLGSLGPPSQQILREIIDFVAGRVEVTSALGELADTENRSVHSLAHLPPELFAAKIGLANLIHHCDEQIERNDIEHDDWVDAWRRRWLGLRQENSENNWTGKRVAVAYADYLTSRSPTPLKVVTKGASLGCDFLLIDTHLKTKSLSTLLRSQQSAAALDECVRETKSRGMRLVVAGSLLPRDLPDLLGRWSPDFVAVRGAVCDGDRTQQVSRSKVIEFKNALNLARQKATERLTCVDSVTPKPVNRKDNSS